MSEKESRERIGEVSAENATSSSKKVTFKFCRSFQRISFFEINQRRNTSSSGKGSSL